MKSIKDTFVLDTVNANNIGELLSKKEIEILGSYNVSYYLHEKDKLQAKVAVNQLYDSCIETKSKTKFLDSLKNASDDAILEIRLSKDCEEDLLFLLNKEHIEDDNRDFKKPIRVTREVIQSLNPQEVRVASASRRGVNLINSLEILSNDVDSLTVISSESTLDSGQKLVLKQNSDTLRDVSHFLETTCQRMTGDYIQETFEDKIKGLEEFTNSLNLLNSKSMDMTSNSKKSTVEILDQLTSYLANIKTRIAKTELGERDTEAINQLIKELIIHSARDLTCTDAILSNYTETEDVRPMKLF